MTAHIETSLEQGVLHLLFTSDDGRNTMDDAFYEELTTALDGALTERAVRCVLISSRGAAFSAGMNLRTFCTSNTKLGFTDSSLGRFSVRLASFPKPLVAAVHGSAIGGGATMLLSCDLAVAAADTKFRLPFASLGIVPELGSSFLLPRAAGTKLANELVLLGNLFDAETAKLAGFINAVVEPGEELALARQWSAQMAAMAPGPVQNSKRLLCEARNDGLLTAIAREGAEPVTAFNGDVLNESVNAFIEKRQPDFSRFF